MMKTVKRSRSGVQADSRIHEFAIQIVNQQVKKLTNQSKWVKETVN